MAEQMNYTAQEQPSKVIKGKAQVDKPKFGRKIIDFLFSDKLDSISNYLAYYILGPSIKDLLYKMGNGALQMALFGGQSGPSMPPMGYNNYNNGYSSARRDPMQYATPAPYGYAQPQPGLYHPRMSLNDISFDTKDDAYLVLDRMKHDIGRYGKVRVADFYTYAGITGQEGNWTLQGNGWYDLNMAHPMLRTDGRWIIEFPPISVLR